MGTILLKILCVVYFSPDAERSWANPLRMLILLFVFAVAVHHDGPLFKVCNCNSHHSRPIYLSFDKAPHQSLVNQPDIVVLHHLLFPNAWVGEEYTSCDHVLDCGLPEIHPLSSRLHQMKNFSIRGVNPTLPLFRPQIVGKATHLVVEAVVTFIGG